MVHKRPFGDEETSNVACKHSRQLEHTNHLVSSAGVVPCNIAPQRTQLSGNKHFISVINNARELLG